MKRFLLVMTLILSLTMLTSCKVNWFGSSFDAPWYFIAVPIVLLFIVIYAYIISQTYVCPECKNEFKPKWNQFSVCMHLNGKRLLKCPKCGKTGLCGRKK